MEGKFPLVPLVDNSNLLPIFRTISFFHEQTKIKKNSFSLFSTTKIKQIGSRHVKNILGLWPFIEK